MNLNLLFGIVAAQVVVFQLVSPPWLQAALGFRLGLRDLPAGVAAGMADHRRRASRGARALAVVLLGAALALLLVPGLTYAQRKIGLAVVSLASSAGLVVLLLAQRRTMDRLISRLPAPTRRSASLRPRRLRDYYPPALEAAPLAVFAATVLLTLLGVLDRLPAGPTPAAGADGFALWLVPSGQLLFLLAGGWATSELLRGPGLVSQQSRATFADPARAVDADNSIRRLKIRGLYVARLLILVMFAVMQMRTIFTPDDSNSWLALAVWGFVALLLGLFGVLMVRLVSLRKSCLP